MSMTKDLLRELSQPDLKREGNNSKFSFEKLSNSKRIFTEPVFELPKPKNLKLEAACLELVNLRYHAGKIKNRISDSIHVSAMDLRLA